MLRNLLEFRYWREHHIYIMCNRVLDQSQGGLHAALTSQRSTARKLKKRRKFVRLRFLHGVSETMTRAPSSPQSSDDYWILENLRHQKLAPKLWKCCDIARVHCVAALMVGSFKETRRELDHLRSNISDVTSRNSNGQRKRKLDAKSLAKRFVPKERWKTKCSRKSAIAGWGSWSCEALRILNITLTLMLCRVKVVNT